MPQCKEIRRSRPLLTPADLEEFAAVAHDSADGHTCSGLGQVLAVSEATRWASENHHQRIDQCVPVLAVIVQPEKDETKPK